MYILPQWKETGMHGGLHFALKQWNPDIEDGIEFEITPLTGKGVITLQIGQDNNEKIILLHDGEVVKHKVLPHLISAGKWIDLWLQIRKGEILLGYKGVPGPLFEWHNEEKKDTFEPMFIAYGTLAGNKIGFFFQCDECHTEVVEKDRFTKIFPIGLWSEAERPVYQNFTLTMRGNGIAEIRLMTLPEQIDYDFILLDSFTRELMLITYKNQTTNVLSGIKSNVPLLIKNSWIHYNIQFTEHKFIMKRNDETILQYESPQPLLYYWFSIGVTKGELTWSGNCIPVDLDGAPRDGAWSAWSPWKCTVKCGGGEGYRTRTCSNPHPNIFGKLCEGLPTAVGRCNDFECGDIGPDTFDKIREHLRQKNFSYVVEEGKRITLENDKVLLKKIGIESPDAYYEWTLNGVFIKPEKGRISFRGDDIIIEDAKPKDTGIYVCMVHRVNKKRVIIRVISLAVKSKNIDIKTRATRAVTLRCRSVILAYVYTDLSLKWMLNDTVYKDYGTVMLAAVDAEKLDPVNESHTGDWKCVVEQKDLRLKWVTNYVQLQVKKAPTTYTNLMEDKLTAPLFAWLKTERNVRSALIIIVVAVVVLVLIGLFLYFQFCTLKRRKYVRNRRKDN